MIEFPWISFQCRGLGTIYRPMVTVFLKGPTRSLPTGMLLDSGADISIIPLSVGEYLGFTRQEDETVVTIRRGGTQTPCLFRDVEMTIGDFTFTTKVAWSQIPNTPDILGRYGVFDHFIIELRQSERKTIFLRLKD